MFSGITWFGALLSLLSSAFLAFGLYHIHFYSGITEGGVLGLTLLLQHWLRLSPAISGAVLNILSYGLGAKTMGRVFIIYSIISTAGFSGAYRLFEHMPPLFPNIHEYPFTAALAGALFVGIGAGVCVRIGGATSGDDAFAMSLARLTRLRIQWIYLASDVAVLLASLSYIPLSRIGYSLLTVILSGQIIGVIQRVPIPGVTKK